MLLVPLDCLACIAGELEDAGCGWRIRRIGGIGGGLRGRMYRDARGS